MKTTKIVALLLVCAMLLGGCSLVTIDKDKVAEQVVAKVNGTKIYKYEINENNVLNSVQYQIYIGQQFGINYTQDEIDQMIIDKRQSSLEDRVKAEVMLQKAQELGITLTDEEKAENMQDAQDSLDSILDSFISQVEQEIADAEAAAQQAADAELEATDDTADTQDAADDTQGSDAAEPEATEKPTDPEVLAEAQVRYQEYLKDNHISLDSEYENLCRQDIVTKVRDYMTSFAVVTDEQVRTWYDQTLVLQQEEMDADPSVFKQKVAGNNIYTYVPERIVAVRDILIAFDDTLSEDLKAAYDEGSTSQYDALLNAALSEYADYVTAGADVKSKLDSGVEPADVVEELVAEMDNISDNTPTYGYIVDPRSTEYSENYVKAATSLVTIGDVANPFADYDGIHVLMLMKVYEPGVIPFEELAGTIKEALLPGAQEDMYDQMLEQWMEESKITYYFDRLNANNNL